jgi:hypothetical protein
MLSIALAGWLAACAAPGRRIVYIRDAAALVADHPARARLLRLVAQRRISGVVPYGLGPLLDARAGRAALAAWIDELHRRGAEVIAPVADTRRLRALAALAAEQPAARFDALVTELEFWNRADRAASLAELRALLAEMRARAAPPPGRPIRVGAYLGYPTPDEASRLAADVDFVFLDYSVRAPARAWSHVHRRGGPLRDRFGAFAGRGVDVWPIFYADGEVDMRDALRGAGVAAAERRFRADLAADAALGGYRVAGFVYFALPAAGDPTLWQILAAAPAP